MTVEGMSGQVRTSKATPLPPKDPGSVHTEAVGANAMAAWGISCRKGYAEAITDDVTHRAAAADAAAAAWSVWHLISSVTYTYIGCSWRSTLVKRAAAIRHLKVLERNLQHIEVTIKAEIEDAEEESKLGAAQFVQASQGCGERGERGAWPHACSGNQGRQNSFRIPKSSSTTRPGAQLENRRGSVCAVTRRGSACLPGRANRRTLLPGSVAQELASASRPP